jgi:hypothetical protein
MYIEKQCAIQNTAANRFESRLLKKYHQVQNISLRRLPQPSYSVPGIGLFSFMNLHQNLIFLSYIMRTLTSKWYTVGHAQIKIHKLCTCTFENFKLHERVFNYLAHKQF